MRKVAAHQHWLPLLLEDLDDVRSYLLQAEAKALQHSCAYALAFPEHSQEEVFGAEKVMVEALCFIDGKLHHFLRPWGQVYFAGHEVFSTANNAFDGLTRLVEINPQACEYPIGHAFPLTKQAQQEVLGADVVVLEALRLFLGELHDCAGPFGEAVEVPSLVRGCCDSLPTGASPPVRCQPSADRADKMVRCHLLILSVSLLILTRRGSSDSLWSARLSHRRLYAFNEGWFSPASAPGCPAALRQGMRPPIYLLLFHHIECVAIEDAHQPETEWAAALPARPPALGQQKRSLGDLFRQRSLVAEA